MNPKNIKRYLNKAEKHYYEGNYKETIEMLTEVLNANTPKLIKAEAYTNRGITKDELGRYQDAIEDFNKALELDPDNDVAEMQKDLAERALQERQA